MFTEDTILIPVELATPIASLTPRNPFVTESMMDLPTIDDIGLLDTRQHVEAFRMELDRCRSMGIDVALAAVHQMLTRIADRQLGALRMTDVDAVLTSIQRAR